MFTAGPGGRCSLAASWAGMTRMGPFPWPHPAPTWRGGTRPVGRCGWWQKRSQAPCSSMWAGILPVPGGGQQALQAPPATCCWEQRGHRAASARESAPCPGWKGVSGFCLCSGSGTTSLHGAAASALLQQKCWGVGWAGAVLGRAGSREAQIDWVRGQWEMPAASFSGLRLRGQGWRKK